VSKPANLWFYYNQAKTWRVTPASLLFLDTDDQIAAHGFNNAAFIFGTALEAALAQVEDKEPKRAEAKRQRVLNKWLQLETSKAPDAPSKPAAAFRTPRATM
jgi:hypothetical protein